MVYRNYVHTTKTNSPGHGFRLQSTLSVRLPKHIPPLLSWMVLTLVLDFVSNPQPFAHDEKLVHIDKVQFSENDMIHYKLFCQIWTSVLQYNTAILLIGSVFLGFYYTYCLENLSYFSNYKIKNFIT